MGPAEDLPAPDVTVADVTQATLRNDALDICRRLRLSMQVVTADPSSVRGAAFGDRWTPAGPTWGRLADSALQAVVADALQLREQRAVELEGVTVVCSPFADSARGVAGAILLAGRAPAHPGTARNEGAIDRRHLMTIASWLAAALAAANGPATASTNEVHRVASLLEILEQAVATSSEREIVRAFIEALSIWTDAESWGYLGDVAGTCELQVVLPGSDWSSAPMRLGAAIAPVDDSPLLLSSSDARAVGFKGDTPILLSRIRSSAAADWLIATRGPAQERDREQLFFYSYVLARALGTLVAIESSRLTWAMFQHLRVALDEGSLREVAGSAVRELGSVIGGPVGLSVVAEQREPILVVGRTSAATRRRISLTSPELLIVPILMARPYGAAIEIGRPADRPLTRRDVTLALRASQVLSDWLNAAIPRLAPQSASSYRTLDFDRLVEQYAQQAFERRQELSMIVVAPSAHLPWDDLASSWVSDMQRQLRPGDVAGRLTSGDVAILLPDTPGDGAHVVARRLRRLIESDCGPGASSLVSIGLLSRPADALSFESLIVEAQTFSAVPSAADAPREHQ